MIEALTDGLRQRGVDATDEAARCRVASRDYSWLSPVLTARLPEEPAGAVAFPTDVDQLAATVALAHRNEVPVTMRGRGTGNYGQGVPLSGGLVVDVSGLDRVLEVVDGWALVEPGVSCGALERAARRSGQELAMFPSTTTSTMGGFLAGGAGGSGSIENGLVWDGFVSALEYLDCSDDPAVTAVAGDTAAPFLHAYGTTGVVTSARVRLLPARDWAGLLASFDAFSDAADAATQLLDGDSLPRLLGVSEAALVATIGPIRHLPAERASLRAVIEVQALDEAATVVAAAGGRVEATGRQLTRLVTALSFNHATLRAKRRDPAICHVQVGGRALTERGAEVRACLPEGRLHLDAMRTATGRGFGGLLISDFHNEAQLRDGMAALAELGVHVVNPHTWMIHDPDGTMAAVARNVDPDGLLNPGKLRRE